jgi:hypothetical protein
MIAWMRRHWRDCPDRSRVAVPGKASQRAGASGFGGDPGASWVSAGTHGTGQHGTRAGQELRRTLARGCNVRNLDPEKAEGLSPELQRALEPLLSAIAELSQRICQYNERVEALAQRATKADYPWNQAFVRYVWLAGMRPGKLFQDRCGIRSHKLLC